MTSVGTDKRHVAPHGLPTTRRRQGAKSLSLGKLFPCSPLSHPARGAPALDGLCSRMARRSQPQPGLPHPSDDVRQALRAEAHAPVYTPALLLVHQDSESHLSQILRAKTDHGTTCPSTAGTSPVSIEGLEHQDVPQDAQQRSQLPGRCRSQQGQQTPGKGWMPKCNPSGLLGSRVSHCLPFLHSQEDTGPAT